MILCGQQRPLLKQPGACNERPCFWRGESKMEVGWDCTQSKLPHTALWFLEVSQFNLLTFGFHFQKCIHWMTQSVILDLLIFYSDAAKSRPSILDTWDLWPVINLVKIMNCHRKEGKNRFFPKQERKSNPLIWWISIFLKKNKQIENIWESKTSLPEHPTVHIFQNQLGGCSWQAELDLSP